MKRINIGRFFKLGLLGLSLILTGTSCVKSVSGRTDFDNLAGQANVTLPEGGLQNFSSQTLLFPIEDETDTAYFHLNYAASDVAPADQTYTVEIDDDALNAYNTANGTTYEKMPDSLYKFANQSVTVPKGANYSGGIPFVVFPSKVDPTISYMLAITIKSAPAGTNISSNFKTIYYHFIGNPIAGAYLWDWTRYNTGDLSGPPTGTSFTDHPTVFIPDDPTTVEVAAGYYNNPNYLITFTNTNGVLTDFKVTLKEDALYDAMIDAGISVVDAPKFLVADPINQVYTITWSVSSLGAPRSFIDKYHR